MTDILQRIFLVYLMGFVELNLIDFMDHSRRFD